jgi:predicted unusual protein kinase regulating ubiquinone biosynthesis (AarF/ABC1/UbiB family)
MPSEEDALARVNSMLGLGLGLAAGTASGRILLAKAADNLDPAWIPGPLRPGVDAALGRAAAARPAPLAFAEVERILTNAWGVERTGDELGSLDPEPVAVTLTSQVHRGVHEGSPVAVKVIRPGVAASLRQDMALFDTVIAPLSAAFGGFTPGPLMAEARERLQEECDLENEAVHMRRFSRALRSGPVVVPSPVTDLCREAVLVSSWLDGRPLSGGVGFGHDSTAAALLGFVVGGIREGLMHCDLDADDVLILDDGRVGVLDFGAVAVIDRARADVCLAVLDAFIVEDPLAFGDGLRALGVLEPGHGEAALKVICATLGQLGGPKASQLDVGAVTAALGRLEAFDTEVVELSHAARMPPGDLYPARGIAQLVSLLARFGASGVWRDQVRHALQVGWRA